MNKVSNSTQYTKLMILTIILTGNIGLLVFCTLRFINKAWNVFAPYFIEDSTAPIFGDYFSLAMLICAIIIVFHLTQMVLDKISTTKNQIQINKQVNKKLAECNLNTITYNIEQGKEIDSVEDLSARKDDYKKFSPEKLYPTDSDVLSNCVGMDAVKCQIQKMKATLKYEKEFGKSSNKKKAHMVFTGNPGTGKTMAARAIAAMLYDAGAIDKPIFMEVNGNDLMGEYIGSTAPTVKKAFERTKDGVLFIDEAYALVESCRNGYASEAINTLLSMLESNPYNVTVIVAGYKEEIEYLLRANSGLRSRMQHTLEFPDYTPEELVSILELNLKNMKHELPSNLKPTLLYVFEKKIQHCNYYKMPFANGRYARNVAESIHTAHAVNYMNNTEIGTSIIAEDINCEELLKLD